MPAIAYHHIMPQSDCLQILLSHDRWASAQLLHACGKLSDDQFHRRFDIGLGSLHDTFTHVVGAMRSWTETLAQVDLRPRLESDGQRRTPAQLLALHEEVSHAFGAEARRRPVEEIVSRRMRDGRTLQFTRGAVAVHVTTHGMHHRAQCLNMLRNLGVKPLPPSAIAEWTALGE